MVNGNVQASAEEQTNSYLTQRIDDNRIDTLKNYLEKTENNSLYFDEQQAREKGISEEEINYSKQEVEKLNTLSQSENTEITEDFTVIVYPESERNITFRSASGGVTKIERGFGGQQKYYLNADDTQTLIDGMESGNTVATILTPIFKGTAGGFTSLNLLQIGAVKAAASGGNGIIMTLTPTTDPSLSPTPTISVVSQ